MPQRILVLGIGNPLVGDEGIGVRVAEELMTSWRFPEHVDVIDAGTMGMSMLGLFSEYDRIVVIDAVDGTGEPAGTILRMDPDGLAPNQVLHSLHDLKLADVLQAASLTGVEPDVEFVGIQVEEMAELVTELTPALEASIPHAVEEVLRVLADLGVLAESTDVDDPAAHVIRAIRTRERMLDATDTEAHDHS
jgi:hydrogenase maturation protease